MGKQKKLVVITGPVAAGKDTVANKLAELYGWPRIITHTSRLPREGEQDGRDYHFVSGDQFVALEEAGQFAETNTNSWTNGNHYGTSKAELARIFTSPTNILWRIDPLAALNLADTFRKNYGVDSKEAASLLARTAVFYITVADWKELEKRIVGRDQTNATGSLTRLQAERLDFEANREAFTKLAIYNEDGQLDQTIEAILAKLGS